MSHPGLVVSEGSAVFSRVCAAGELRHARRAALTDLRAPPVLWGDRPLTHFIFHKARSEEEMKIDAWRRIAFSFHILSFTHT